jgi:hypothetical protein
MLASSASFMIGLFYSIHSQALLHKLLFFPAAQGSWYRMTPGICGYTVPRRLPLRKTHAHSGCRAQCYTRYAGFIFL